jgi:hypothetical protein
MPFHPEPNHLFVFHFLSVLDSVLSLLSSDWNVNDWHAQHAQLYKYVLFRLASVGT